MRSPTVLRWVSTHAGGDRLAPNPRSDDHGRKSLPGQVNLTIFSGGTRRLPTRARATSAGARLPSGALASACPPDCAVRRHDSVKASRPAPIQVRGGLRWTQKAPTDISGGGLPCGPGLPAEYAQDVGGACQTRVGRRPAPPVVSALRALCCCSTPERVMLPTASVGNVASVWRRGRKRPSGRS